VETFVYDHNIYTSLPVSCMYYVCVSHVVSTKLDLLGDHPYTNYREAYMKLQRLGYTVEVLRKPWSCFDAALYSVLVLCDLEESLGRGEVAKLEADVRYQGLSLLVIADWYDEIGLLEGAIVDDNTHSKWFPITGGSDVPAMNTLLGRFGIQFGLQAFKGSIRYENSMVSGVSIYNYYVVMYVQ
jgi:membrane-bound transcription factor site-1 protease